MVRASNEAFVARRARRSLISCGRSSDAVQSALLDQIRARASDPSRATDDAARAPARAFPPIDERSIALAEKQLGLRLPTPLRKLYTLVGNGGFGPSYGLLGLIGGATNEDGLDSVGAYQSLREPSPDDRHWSWPISLLPVGHLGCAMFICVDCSTDDASLVWFEPNPHETGDPWDDAFIPLNISLETWLRQWIDGSGDDLLGSAWTAKFGTSDD